MLNNVDKVNKYSERDVAYNHHYRNVKKNLRYWTVRVCPNLGEYQPDSIGYTAAPVLCPSSQNTSQFLSPHLYRAGRGNVWPENTAAPARSRTASSPGSLPEGRTH